MLVNKHSLSFTIHWLPHTLVFANRFALNSTFSQLIVTCCCVVVAGWWEFSGKVSQFGSCWPGRGGWYLTVYYLILLHVIRVSAHHTHTRTPSRSVFFCTKMLLSALDHTVSIFCVRDTVMRLLTHCRSTATPPPRSVTSWGLEENSSALRYPSQTPSSKSLNGNVQSSTLWWSLSACFFSSLIAMKPLLVCWFYELIRSTGHICD